MELVFNSQLSVTTKSHIKQEKIFKQCFGEEGQFSPQNQTEESVECHIQL